VFFPLTFRTVLDFFTFEMFFEVSFSASMVLGEFLSSVIEKDYVFQASVKTFLRREYFFFL